MRIADYLARGVPSFSFEFFPPKTDEGLKSLYATLAELRDLGPTYCSVTYGAGGSTRTRTVDLVKKIKGELGIEAMAHLTCVGSRREELERILDELAAAGIENALLLRGDPPKGQAEFVPEPGGFAHASDLVAFCRGRFSFCIGGACYPEGHVESSTRELDLDYTHAKVRAGCDFLITQLFFDNAVYFDFVARARARGIRVPILPGIMPITDVAQIERFTKMCGASVPPRLAVQLERQRGDPQAVLQLGIAHATLQCVGLLRGGAPGIHFYTLNRSPATRAILAALRAWDGTGP